MCQGIWIFVDEWTKGIPEILPPKSFKTQSRHGLKIFGVQEQHKNQAILHIINRIWDQNDHGFW